VQVSVRYIGCGVTNFKINNADYFEALGYFFWKIIEKNLFPKTQFD